MALATHRHLMPFGAEITDDGQARFRLWAPTARRVDLCVQEITLPISAVDSNGGTVISLSLRSGAGGGDQLARGDIGNAVNLYHHPPTPSLQEWGAKSTVLILPMQVESDGWFSCTTDRAKAGSRYRFRIDGGQEVPDPASRFQPDDVHGASEVIDPAAWRWHTTEWQGRPWEEAFIYELHVGTFTRLGNFSAVEERLDYLRDLGITAVELMPVAEFPGRRGWGYDGAYLFAPESSYGRPEALKSLVDAAHARGLMVLLDVVYNHFGPEGNYLHLYAPQFFTERHHTPWGAAINYDGEHRHWVRQFFIHNALYWLEEYQFDGLRLDAIHAIFDESQPDIFIELAECVKETFGDSRHIHLILENDNNAARYLTRDELQQPRWYAAQWNDDIHHALHLLLTGENEGYYVDYADDPVHHLSRCLSEGFAYQGEASIYREGQLRGETSRHLPPSAFISFLQNHDQIGNRAFGERIAALATPERIRAGVALLLLAPSMPLIFMGQEWGCHQPFLYFCDFSEEFAASVVEGRRQEFSRFARFRDPAARATIPDPMAESTFVQSVLDWESHVVDSVPPPSRRGAGSGDRFARAAVDFYQHPAPSLAEGETIKSEVLNLEPASQQWLALHRELLAIRQRELVPWLRNTTAIPYSFTRLAERVLSCSWRLGGGATLTLFANFGEGPCDSVKLPCSHLIYATHEIQKSQLPSWSVLWYLDEL